MLSGALVSAAAAAGCYSTGTAARCLAAAAASASQRLLQATSNNSILLRSSHTAGSRYLPSPSGALSPRQTLATGAGYHTSSALAQRAEPDPIIAEAAEDGTTRLLVDHWGAVSSVPADCLNDYLTALGSQQYANQDGRRVDDGRYRAFIQGAKEMLPAKRVITDALRLLAHGGDASFYRLLPKAVIKVHNEAEVQALLALAGRHQVPLTFRAAGTSLSGQAITDSVLVKLSHVGRHFRGYDILDGGRRVRVEPGLLGGEVNKFLAAYARRHKLSTIYRIGPDPASIDSAMIGGIAANNASGMCCGVDQNSYKTVGDMRLLLADGGVLDTGDPVSVAAFLQTHKDLCRRLSDLAARVQADTPLADRIHRKYKIKNTTGYSLNALVDFPPEDPINIIKHVMIGSEGTLGFISSITYNTVEEMPHKASAFVLFPTIHAACEVVMALRGAGRLPSAVELCDYSSLRLAGDSMKALVPHLSTAQEGAAGLLVEVKAPDIGALDQKISAVQDIIRGTGVTFGGSKVEATPLESYPFKKEARDFTIYWDFRKGLIPIIGGSRGVGTSMLIEDVVCPPQHLADMTQDLIDLFKRHGYEGASACGHALDGNLHLVFAQGFRTPEEVATFGSLMADMADIVANKYEGSLKGEHGTGRNMAPFVELEWGRQAKRVMEEIKDIFDPHHLLNPGVILNPDPNAHMLHLKPSPAASPIIDHCMECGYCEAVCPSRDLSLTPRQRITTFREINRLRGLGPGERTQEQTQRMQDMARDWQYAGDATCAADGMCGVRCPVKINTGEFVKQTRAAAVEAGATQPGASSSGFAAMAAGTTGTTATSSSTAAGGPSGGDGGKDTTIEGGGPGAAGAAAAASSTPRNSSLSLGSMWVARHFTLVNSGVPVLLNTVNFFHRLLGPKPLEVVSGALNRWTGHLVPQWNRYLPKGGSPVRLPPLQPPAFLPTEAGRQTGGGVPRRVLYFPTCVTRMMGPSHGDPEQRPVSDVFMELANKAGYEVIVPQGVEGLCCGMMFDSRGAKTAAGLKYAEAAQALLGASEMGQLPVVVDNSPCLAHLKSGGLAAEAVRTGLHEPVGFTLRYLAPYLDFSHVKEAVAIHVPCTSKQAGLEGDFVKLAEMCAADVTPTGIPCCGMAGDRGLRYPELTASACQHLDLPPEAADGYSTSRTCEIGISQAAGMHFRSILHLVNAATSPKAAAPGRPGGGAAGELPTEGVNQASLRSPSGT